MGKADRLKLVNMNDEIMYIADTAKFYNIKVDALYKRIYTGKVPFHKFGRKYVFLRSELIADTLER